MTLLKGALVSFTPTFLPIPVPDVTVFQYNPESLTHTWSQPAPSADGGGSCGRTGTTTGHPMAVPGYPGEQFDLTVMLDANDDIAGGGPSGALASVSGVYTRVAAMESAALPGGCGVLVAAGTGDRRDREIALGRRRASAPDGARLDRADHPVRLGPVPDRAGPRDRR